MTSHINPTPVARHLRALLPVLFPFLALLPQPLAAQADPNPPKTEARKSPNSLIDSETWFRCIEEGKQKSQVMAHLDHLCNRIGPRLTASDNYSIATRWAAERFRSFGMEHVSLDKWGSFAIGFNRGASKGMVISPESLAQSLEFSTNAWSAGTKGRQQGPVFVIEGPARPSMIEEQAQAIRGTWVFSKRINSGSTRSLKALKAAGALGLVRPARTRYLYTMSFGGHMRRWNRLPTFPVISLNARQFRKIANAAKKAASQEGGLKDKDKDKDKTNAQVVLSFDIRNHFKKGPIDVHNVIAEIRGSEKPDEVIIVGGHIDSWDGATGATDNGTGTASTLEAARILMAAGARPKRTIRFMLFGGEEQGLLGSRSYVQRHRAEIKDKVSAVFIHDMGTNYVSGIGGPPKIKPFLDRAFEGFDTIDSGFPFNVYPAAASLGGGSSDHASFRSIGIPGFFWNQKGRSKYGHGWHTQYDSYDLAIPEYQKQTATVVALGALAMANLPEILPRWIARRRAARPTLPQPFDPKKPLLGVYTQNTTITGIVPQSLASNSGLKGGDKLLELAGTKISKRNSIGQALRAWIKKGMPATTVKVTRGGKTMVLELRREAKKTKGKGQSPVKKKGRKRRARG